MLGSLMFVDKNLHDLIKSRLHAAGSSFSEIARELNRSTTTVITVSQGRCRSRFVEEAIANKLGTDAKSLWPHRFEEEKNHDLET